MPRPPVLIVGAGPTGLVLALGLARRGVPFRIVAEARGPGEHSRAMVLHARTLEFYRQFGFADAMVAQGVPVRRVHLRAGGAGGAGGGHELGAVSLADLGAGLTPYPTVLAYPQDDHERFLLDQLRAAGADVEWETTFTGLMQDAGGVRATLARGDGREETVEADYVCGCDGAHSAVRHALGIGFPGGTYDQLYYVVDCETEGGFERDFVANLGTATFALLLPVRSRGVQRLIGLVPPGAPAGADVTFDDLRAHVEGLIGRRVTAVHWFSTYRVHHRVAEHFRVGRAFLLGDAGHIHSPAGGQGMNTGIGDAINLGWKLAMVAQGRAPAALLDSYEPERIAFARALVETTDRAFTAVVGGGLAGEFVRRVLIPLVFGVGARVPAARHAFFRVVSQTEIEYEDSALSAGDAGRVQGGSIRAGDRLPWVETADNFAPLRSLEWQAHVYGAAAPALENAVRTRGLALHNFPWSPQAEAAGLARDALYLVRPDGYVGLAGQKAQAEELDAYLSRHGIKPAG